METGAGGNLDEFETGYSSLSYPRRLPTSRVKIDGSFVSQIQAAPDDAALTPGGIAITHTLQLRVTADGVEKLEQARFLRDVACDELQGFLMRPVSPEAFVRRSDQPSRPGATLAEPSRSRGIQMSVTRREFLASILAAATARPAFGVPGEENGLQGAGAAKVEPLDVPPEAWKPLVSPEAYRVLFEEATERPGSSPMDREKQPGTFLCAACLLPLFRSETKFDSGTGWPSFFDVIPGHIGTRRDFKLLVPRTEYHCARCGGHQGHVFRDGPPPTGLRYCNNGVALRFVPDASELPPLRRPPA